MYGEKIKKLKEKNLQQKLYDSFKQEDLNSFNKPTYNIRLDGEDQSKKEGFFSKIFILDENNQYGFAMTKPLPIGVFKKEEHLDMDILNNSVKHFDPKAKVDEIFIGDIEFTAYYDAHKKMYNEVYPCIFEPKTKVSIDRKSVYQLLSNMRMGKKENVLMYL